MEYKFTKEVCEITFSPVIWQNYGRQFSKLLKIRFIISKFMFLK